MGFWIEAVEMNNHSLNDYIPNPSILLIKRITTPKFFNYHNYNKFAAF
jgi:hypothetical protein